MVKFNRNGFTLIELLAVITIMGILMIIAIPSITRVIENSRKDTFINTIENYSEGAKLMWSADNLSCDGFPSSAVAAGYYFIEVDSSNTSVPQLLESGGKSPWGNRHIRGHIVVIVKDRVAPGKDGVINGKISCCSGGTVCPTGIVGTEACVSNDDVITRKIGFFPYVTDGIHGLGVNSSGERYNLSKQKFSRGDLTMSGASYDAVSSPVLDAAGNPTGDYILKDPTFFDDLNGNGVQDVGDPSIPITKCVEN